MTTRVPIDPATLPLDPASVAEAAGAGLHTTGKGR
jgi:hypothetical protein